jgi:hypothetical protein
LLKFYSIAMNACNCMCVQLKGEDERKRDHEFIL